MTETKHTPGPWTASPHSKHKHSISAAGWSEFAKVVTRMQGNDNDSIEGLANASLIAAAPELLDAMQSAVVAMEALEHPPGWGALAKARAAIAKAGVV